VRPAERLTYSKFYFVGIHPQILLENGTDSFRVGISVLEYGVWFPLRALIFRHRGFGSETGDPAEDRGKTEPIRHEERWGNLGFQLGSWGGVDHGTKHQ